MLEQGVFWNKVFYKNFKTTSRNGGVPLVNVHFKILLWVGEGNLGIKGIFLKYQTFTFKLLSAITTTLLQNRPPYKISVHFPAIVHFPQ